jgi:hypothetical protein
MSKLDKETYSQQAKLANYCRDGKEPEGLIDINQKNLFQYRRLVFNIINDILETSYPIAYSFLDRKVWEDTVFDFFIEHKCQTAQVWRMPFEFYGYCVENKLQEKLGIPFLNDLLYFEWLEMEVHTMEDIEYPKVKKEGDWMSEVIALNPEHKIIPLTYPVHTTSPGPELEQKVGNYFLLIYREKETGHVHFVDLSMFYVYILENIKNGALMKEILVEANSMFQINDIKLLKDRSLEFINDLKKRQFIIGISS